MFFGKQDNRVIRCCIALLCIAALVMTVSAATGRVGPVNVQPVVTASPQATQVVQPAADRIVLVNTTPVPERVIVVEPVTTTPVVNERVTPVVTVTTIPMRKPVVVQTRGINSTGNTAGTGAGGSIVPMEQKPVTVANPAWLAAEGLRETTPGVKDPQTGRDLSKEANPGAGLPGGSDLAIPSAEDQWNNRFGAGGIGDVMSGTPFDDNPLGNPMDGFFSQHGGNLPDPMAGYGSGRSGISPASGAAGLGGTESGESPSATGAAGLGGTEAGGSPRETGAAGLGGTEAGGSPHEAGAAGLGGAEAGGSPRDTGAGGKGADGAGLLPGTHKYYYFEYASGGPGSRDQQYEGEGGYSGGTGGHSANDVMSGSRGRMTGRVVGGTDPGEAGLGTDTGGKTPALFQAIENYVARGGKVRGGTPGYNPGDAGQGSDTGLEGNQVTRLKQALNAQRFIISADATDAEAVPWWLEKKVSPLAQAGTSQTGAVQAGTAGTAAVGAGQAQAK